MTHPSRAGDSAVAFLAARRSDGDVLELGIGTGRVALPLSRRIGRPVWGIDASAESVAALRDKDGGETLPVTVGDFLTTVLPRAFSLVYVVGGTLNMLTTQARQRDCFAAAARHLEPGGCLVVDTLQPPVAELDRGRWFTVPDHDQERILVGALVCRRDGR